MLTKRNLSHPKALNCKCATNIDNIEELENDNIEHICHKAVGMFQASGRAPQNDHQQWEFELPESGIVEWDLKKNLAVDRLHQLSACSSVPGAITRPETVGAWIT
jgi:hypothetical protein